MDVDSSHLAADQNARLDALYHLAVELSAQRDLDAVLNTALQHCLTLTDSQFGFIGLNLPDNESMDVVATQGFHPPSDFYQHFHVIPLRPNIFSYVVLHNQPIRTADALADPRRVGQPQDHPPVHTFMGVPLRDKNRPIGMIGVANRPKPYADEHEQLLMTYAAQVAIIMRNAQLYEELSRSHELLEHKVAERTQELEDTKEALAQKASQLQTLFAETVDIQELERQRIAQGLHDGINQLLYGALLELKAARQRLSTSPSSSIESEDSLKAVQEILHQIDSEIKHVIYDLRPPTLDALGLLPALRRYAERVTRYTGIQCDVQALGDPIRLTPRAEVNIYRMVQEALQNVSSHAKASFARVVLVYSRKGLKLTVLDDGVGFDLNEVQQRTQDHLGLLGMRERAENLGGRCVIRSTAGAGTQVEMSLPIQPLIVEETA